MKRQWRLVLIATYLRNYIHFFVLLQQNEYDQTIKLLRAVSFTVGQGFICLREWQGTAPWVSTFCDAGSSASAQIHGRDSPGLIGLIWVCMYESLGSNQVFYLSRFCQRCFCFPQFTPIIFIHEKYDAPYCYPENQSKFLCQDTVQKIHEITQKKQQIDAEQQRENDNINIWFIDFV